MALAAGIGGLLVANYGNSVTFQFPTSILLAFSMVFLELNWKWHKKLPPPNSIKRLSQNEKKFPK
jgi:hypothetical protein